MTGITRRTFLSAASTSGIMWPLVRGLDLAWQSPASGPRRRTIVTFDEPGFPAVDAIPLRPLPGARSAASVAELADALQPGSVLAWRHGSTFPAEAWKAIFGFLENGGNLLYVGGEPWTRPVTGAVGDRRVQPRTVAQLQALRLNQSYRLRLNGPTLHRIAGANSAQRPLPSDTWVAALEPRFTDTQDFPAESGSPGARDALLRPLAYAHATGGDPRFPAAAVAYAIDRLRGPFAGGRWVFWLASAPPQDDEWEWLLDEASRGPVDFRVGPTFGCFHQGEQPSLILGVHRPGAAELLKTPCEMAIDGPGDSRRTQTVDLQVGEHATMHVPLSGSFAPGLYRITVEGGPLGRTRTGFWMYDHDLFTSGDALTFDAHTLRRDGRAEPVVGTTTMSASVHRDFLFEPNAAVWDDTFAELASLRINMVRTGLWSGWRRISVDANVVDEAFLRALEAYYLTARRHGLPVIFNVFAFAPEDFGSGDPYFDPRALEGQRAFLSALARRMAPTRGFIWDLINEPSFASPLNLWTLRPIGSAHERRAFLAWLAARYQPAEGGSEGLWQEVVRRRWRLRPDEEIGAPSEEDFTDTYLMGARRPYRALDYALFAQDAFERWIGEMTSAIRAGGSQAAITVGQDENGLRTSPAPLFHHRSVAFTSMHTWWSNDALLWDGVLAKAGGKPLLVSETGIMQRQRPSGEAVRSPADFAALLSRKIGYAFAAHAFGVIQWCYETNPFMNSDNEVAIGLKRVDGSVKPEHGVLAAAAAFVARNRNRFDGYVAPDVALVVPTADQLSPRSLAATATRTTVRAFYEDLQIPLYAVAEHRAGRDLGQPRVIVLPACGSISEDAWQAITGAVDKGATLICSGSFESDDAGLPSERLGVPSRLLRMVEEMPAWEGVPATAFRFGGTLPESWDAAALPAPRRIPRGAGRIVHHPLPIEWAEPTASIAHFYRAAIAPTKLAPRVELVGGAKAGVLVATIPFRDAWLLVAVNETARSHEVIARRPGSAARVSFEVAADHARMAFVDPRTWKMLDLS